jgi:hypothetical protein
MTITGNQGATIVVLTSFALWGAYFLRGRTSRWAVALWLPFTLICFLVTLCTAGLFLSLGGNHSDLGGYFYVRGVWLFLPVAVVALGLLILSLRRAPEGRLLTWDSGLATIALLGIDCALIFGPDLVQHSRNRYFVRMHFMDENGGPVIGDASKYQDSRRYHSDSAGQVTMEGTKTIPLEFWYRGYSLHPQMKIIKCSYDYQERPEPHLHGRYTVSQDRNELNQRRLVADTTTETDYSFTGGPVDVKVVMETLR